MDEFAGVSEDHPAPARGEAPRPRFLTLKRTAMAAATAFLAINLWTGAPLIAVWVGSQVVGQTTLSMKAVCVVIVVLAALVFSMAIALSWLNATYERLTGQPSRERRLTWLRSMNTQDDDEMLVGMRVSALERIVVSSVYLAVIALLVWFFFFARAPLPG
jgi:hypothetical protein